MEKTEQESRVRQLVKSIPEIISYMAQLDDSDKTYSPYLRVLCKRVISSGKVKRNKLILEEYLSKVLDVESELRENVLYFVVMDKYFDFSKLAQIDYFIIASVFIDNYMGVYSDYNEFIQFQLNKCARHPDLSDRDMVELLNNYKDLNYIFEIGLHGGDVAVFTKEHARRSFTATHRLCLCSREELAIKYSNIM